MFSSWPKPGPGLAAALPGGPQLAQLYCPAVRLVPRSIVNLLASALGSSPLATASVAEACSGIASGEAVRRNLVSTRRDSGSDDAGVDYYQGYGLPDGSGYDYSVWELRSGQRGRFVGARNRVLSGLLLHQVRVFCAGAHARLCSAACNAQQLCCCGWVP